MFIYIIGGQPVKGTKILSIYYSNTVAGKYWNIFIIYGIVVFVLRYSKGSHHIKQLNIIHYFIPSKVRRLVILYL